MLQNADRMSPEWREEAVYVVEVQGCRHGLLNEMRFLQNGVRAGLS